MHPDLSKPVVPYLIPWSLGSVLLSLVIVYSLPGLLLKPFYASHPAMVIVGAQALTLTLWLGLFHGLTQRLKVNLRPILGLVKTHSISDFWRYMLLTLGCMMLASSALELLAGRLGWPIPHPYQTLPLEQRQALAIAAIVLAPMTEELVFRGYVQSTLLSLWQPSLAIGGSTVLFLLFHATYYTTPLALAYVVLMGLILGTCRYFSQSTYPGILAHMVNNIIAAYTLLPF